MSSWLEVLRPEQALVAQLTAQGQSVSEISLSSLGWSGLQSVSEDTVRTWHRSPAWQSALAHYKSERAEVLRALAEDGARKSLDCLIAELEHKDVRVRLKAASYLLAHHRAYLSTVVELKGVPQEGAALVPKEALDSAEKLLGRLGLEQENAPLGSEEGGS